MASNDFQHAIPLMSRLLLLLLLMVSISEVRGISSHMLDRDSLDSFVRDYAIKKTERRHNTGKVYGIPLPSNFSGMKASIVRVRSGSLWRRGANFSFFHIPPKVLPWPFVQRLDIIYENLGNWSSYYYDVPNYTFVTPVIGLLTYDANASRTNYGMVDLNIMENPILVHFPQVSLPNDNKNVTLKCVRFVTNGTVEITDVTMKNSCIARGQGHFSIVIPSLKPEEKEKMTKKTKWLVIGIGLGIVGLLLLIVIGTLIYKFVSVKRRLKMERESEKSEALDTIWVGRSRMPSASGIRTQPALENNYVP